MFYYECVHIGSSVVVGYCSNFCVLQNSTCEQQAAAITAAQQGIYTMALMSTQSVATEVTHFSARSAVLHAQPPSSLVQHGN